jgi:hypothetical protein
MSKQYECLHNNISSKGNGNASLAKRLELIAHIALFYPILAENHAL